MSQPQAGVPAVDVRTAHDRATDSASPSLLVDVREPEEFANVRAEGAVLVPMSTFVTRMNELPRDRPILVICQSGNRSAAVTGHLLRNGWTDVSNVAGGTGEWEKAGLPVRRGAPAPGEGELGT
jgi:rhodanese-related sulfurtransferase